MKSIASVLDSVLKKAGFEEKMSQFKVFEIWDKAVGEQIAKVATPYDIKGKTLLVKARDAVWMRQLVFLETDIKDKLNMVLGHNTVGKIVFRLTDSGYRNDYKEGN